MKRGDNEEKDWRRHTSKERQKRKMSKKMRKREKKKRKTPPPAKNQTVKYLMENSVHLIPLSDLPS